MKSNYDIEKTVRLAAGNLHYMLQAFYPALRTDYADVAERNISFQFAHAFLSWHPQGGAFFEVPIRQSKCPPKYDFYLHDEGTGIVGETKMLDWQIGNPTKKFEEIRDDKEKLCSDQIDSMLNLCMTTGTFRPKKVFRLLMAVTWKENIVKWWREGDNVIDGRLGKCNPPISRQQLLGDMFADSIHVIGYLSASIAASGNTKVETLHFLYAYNEVTP